nr:MAG TPA: hypothetical protein [Caudoviricetes sp.]
MGYVMQMGYGSLVLLTAVYTILRTAKHGYRAVSQLMGSVV